MPSTELSVIVPTYNESENIAALVKLLRQSLDGIQWEVIFVDDNSPDHTSRVVRDIAQQDEHVRCLQRIGRRGLSSAVIEGMLASSSTYLAVMDADMQHDETLLPIMLQQLKQEYDLVIGSRYIDNDSTGTMPEHRVRISRVATLIGNLVLKHQLSDPMSGFFMLKRELFERVLPKLSGKGFKILVDIVASSPQGTYIDELPYHMKKREFGDSKLSAIVVWEFFSLLVNKLFGRYLPPRFIMFTTVGLTGVSVHTLTLYILHKYLLLTFAYAQVASTIVAMTSNYFLNNVLTFNDNGHKGKHIYRGLLSFYITCSLGALINIAVASMTFEYGVSWWLAGICGAAVGAVWNFALSSTYTWRYTRINH